MPHAMASRSQTGLADDHWIGNLGSIHRVLQLKRLRVPYTGRLHWISSDCAQDRCFRSISQYSTGAQCMCSIYRRWSVLRSQSAYVLALGGRSKHMHCQWHELNEIIVRREQY